MTEIMGTVQLHIRGVLQKFATSNAFTEGVAFEVKALDDNIIEVVAPQTLITQLRNGEITSDKFLATLEELKCL